MTPAAINQTVHPWSDAEHRRFEFRMGLFQRRGLAEDEAEVLASRLVLRDQQRDDRRVCLECVHLQRSGHCAEVIGKRMPVACEPERFTVISTQLARCSHFAWAVPA
jgi:hypothetical protein